MTRRQLTLILLSFSLGFWTMHCTPRSDQASGRHANKPDDTGSRQSPQILFPQLAPPTGERAFPEALIQGNLHLSNGCLRVGADGEGSLIIWPPHVRLDRTGDSIRVLDESSQIEAEVGQTVQLGGGEIEPTAPILQELREPLPATCPGPYWLASGLIAS